MLALLRVVLANLTRSWMKYLHTISRTINCNKEQTAVYKNTYFKLFIKEKLLLPLLAYFHLIMGISYDPIS